MKNTDKLLYTKDHEWVEVIGENQIRIGITQFAVDSLGDIVYVELPEDGANLSAHDEFATVESVKSTSGIYTPVAGKVIAINETLNDEPEQMNDAPYEAGWIVELLLEDALDSKDLLDLASYEALIEEE